MNCKEFSRLLEESRPERREEMARHAAVCRRCHKMAADWEKLSLLFAELEPARAPEDFERRLFHAIRGRALPGQGKGAAGRFSLPRAWQLVQYPGSIAAGVAMGILIALALLLFRSSPLPTSAPDRQSAIGEGPVTVESNPPKIEPGVPVEAASASDQARPRGRQEQRDYVEVMLKGTGENQVIVRLPRTIKINTASESEEHYLSYVSH